MKLLLARLLRRWDLGVEERLALPFDRSIAIVNLRRMELACLLGLFTDILQLSVGQRVPSIIAGIPLELVSLALSHVAQSRFSLKGQNRLLMAFFAVALLDRLWGTVSVSANGRLGAGYPYLLLCFTILFAFPPRSFAIVNAVGLVAYSLVVMLLPFSIAEKSIGIVNTTIIAGICQVADWLVYNTRRSDHDQRLLIRAQNQRLTEQNRELDELMAVTAHDLRSPLYGLRNLLDLALRRAPEKPDLPARVLRDGVYSLDAMIALVTRLLDAHAAEHRPLGVIAIGDVRDPLLSAVRRIGPQAEAASIAIMIDLPESPLRAMFEKEALARILDNLLGNAVRFCPAEGRVTIRGLGDGKDIWIEVEDNGPGISPHEQSTLFEKFSRAANSIKAGTGMGLFIAATLAERVGARLAYRPAQPNGAIFRITLPSHD